MATPTRIKGDLVVEGTLNAATATTTKAGLVKMAAKQADATSTSDIVTAFNALIDKLQDAGIMAKS